MLHKRNIGLDEARLNDVVTEAGARIEGPNVMQRLFDGVDRTSNGFGDFFVALGLKIT